jgi:SAM-dependent methyltransferase
MLDFAPMPHPIPPHETRTIDQLREQLEVERELAQRLLRAGETRGLYSEVYDEFLRRVPHHPSLAQKEDPATQTGLVSLQLRLLEPFLRPETRFLEVGGGDCALAIELSRRVHRVTAVEASAEMPAPPAGNLEVIVSDAPPYPLSGGSVDLAFSCHFIEHLRPDDALLHLREMHRLLAPGGRYVCVTPHRLWGPHDISRYFSDVPEGLHLHEYSHNDLLGLLKQAGFRRRRVIRHIGGSGAWLPHLGHRSLEGLLALLPLNVRRRALEALSGGRQPPLRLLEQVIVTASR